MVYKIDEVPKEQTRLSLWDGNQSTLQYWNLVEDPENKTTINQVVFLLIILTMQSIQID